MSEKAKLNLPPGPRSRIPGRVFRQLRRDPLAFLTKLSETYGDICSFSSLGQRYIVLNHPDLVREMLITQADAFWKGPALQNSKGILGEGLLTAEGDVHKLQRRLMTPAFHAKHVETYAGETVESTRSVVGEWGKEPGVVDVRPAMMRLTLLIAGRALFGALLEEETAVVGESMEILLKSFTRAVVPWGKLLSRLPIPSTQRIKAARKNLHDLIHRIVAARRAEQAAGEKLDGRRDLLSILIAATDSEGTPGSTLRLTDTQLRDQAITLLTAGHETTANAMTFTLYLLAKYPAEQEKLRGEIEAVMGADETPTVEMLERMPRVRWVLSESMRLLPPVWTVGRQNQRAVTLGGYTVPAKCTILAPQWMLQRSARFWPEPLAFLPERWETPVHARFAYFPFSTGPRNCIGEAFAWLEMSLALPMLVRAFAFVLPAGAGEIRLMPSITLRPRDAVRLSLSRR